MSEQIDEWASPPLCMFARDTEGSRRTRTRTVDALLDGTLTNHLDDGQFTYLRKLAREHAGIVIADFKRSMLLRRITKRLKALDLPTVEEYCALLRGPAGPAEIEHLINVLTTNKTEFFREAHHFNHLRNQALPAALAAKQGNSSKRLRIWSAGCSTGEEAWSLGMTIHNELAPRGEGLSGLDVKILATDIDTDVLTRASAGRYRTSQTTNIPRPMRHKYLHAVAENSDLLEMTPDIRSLMTFKQLNLHGAWPFRGPFDIIFCRNVVIYFDRVAQRALFNRMADMMTTGGFLYCGHSESLHGLSSRFRPIGRSIYERLE